MLFIKTNPFTSLLRYSLNISTFYIWGHVAGAVASAVASKALDDGSGSSGSSRQSVTPIGAQGGLFGGTSFNGRQLHMQMDPRLQRIQDKGIASTEGFLGRDYSNLMNRSQEMGSGLFDQMRTYDPYDVAQQQFNKLDAILAPGRERERLAQEGRLFSQGRLGSTGGSLQQEALLNAQEQQRSMDLLNSFGQAQTVQDLMFNRAMQAGMFGPQMFQAQQLAGQAGMQTAFSPMQQQLALTQAMAPFAGAQTTSSIQGPSLQSQISGGLAQGAAGLFGQGLNQAFSNNSGFGYDTQVPYAPGQSATSWNVPNVPASW